MSRLKPIQQLKGFRTFTDPKEVVKAAHSFLSKHPKRHIKGQNFVGGDEDVSNCTGVCANGALLVFANADDSLDLAYMEAARLIRDQINKKGNGTREITTVNDGPRGRERILKYMERAAA